jgi:hypothetical protein
MGFSAGGGTAHCWLAFVTFCAFLQFHKAINREVISYTAHLQSRATDTGNTPRRQQTIPETAGTSVGSPLPQPALEVLASSGYHFSRPRNMKSINSEMRPDHST